MSVDEILAAVNAAAPGEAIQLAERLLSEYHGDDKAMVAPSVMETATIVATDGEEITI